MATTTGLYTIRQFARDTSGVDPLLVRLHLAPDFPHLRRDLQLEALQLCLGLRVLQFRARQVRFRATRPDRIRDGHAQRPG